MSKGVLGSTCKKICALRLKKSTRPAAFMVVFVIAMEQRLPAHSGPVLFRYDETGI